MWVCFGVGAEESEGKQMGSDGVTDGKGRRGGCTITPLLCHYISEWHSFSLMAEVVQGSWSGGGRGAWSIRVLEVELLDHSQGMDFSMGEPHVI